MFWNTPSHCAVVFSSGWFPCLLEIANDPPHSERSIFIHCCQLLTDSIIPVLSTVFESLVSVRLGQFMGITGMLPTTEFVYKKNLSSTDARMCISHTLQNALQSWQDRSIVLIGFRAAFDRLTIRDFSLSSALWALEVLCSLFSLS